MQKEDIELADILVRLNSSMVRIEKVLAPTLLQRFLFGMVTGFGTIVGATVVVSLVLLILRPLENLDLTKPLVEAIREAQNKR